MDERESAAWLSLITVLELLPPALDAQLRRDAGLTHFEFVVLSMLRFAPQQTMRMKAIADAAEATLPRVSHVISRLEARGLVERAPAAGDGRATDVLLTPRGRRAVVLATPDHVATVRRLVFDVLDDEQLGQLADIASRIAHGLDPDDRFGAQLTQTEKSRISFDNESSTPAAKI
jgi:DNA-binding MarR family transcriptional regulator